VDFEITGPRNDNSKSLRVELAAVESSGSQAAFPPNPAFWVHVEYMRVDITRENVTRSAEATKENKKLI
jgi:hypothetical protein